MGQAFVGLLHDTHCTLGGKVQSVTILDRRHICPKECPDVVRDDSNGQHVDKNANGYRMNRLKLAVFGAAFAAAAALFIANRRGSLDAGAIEDLLTGTGLLGPGIFLVVMISLQPVGVPAVAFIVASSLLWPAPVAIGLSLFGNVVGSFISFSFARWLGRDWVSARIPERLRRHNERIGRGGVVEVIVLRLITGPLPVADWFLGVLAVRIRPFFIGTAIGMIPWIVVFVLIGGSVGGLFG